MSPKSSDASAFAFKSPPGATAVAENIPNTVDGENGIEAFPHDINDISRSPIDRFDFMLTYGGWASEIRITSW